MFDIVKETIREFLADRCMTLAGAISYYAVFALPPLLALILMMVGLLVDPMEVEDLISREAGTLIGPDAAQMVSTMIREARDVRGGPATVAVGVIALLIGATGAFVQLQIALNLAWEVPEQAWKGGLRGHILKRVLSLGMILGIGFLLLVSMVLGAVITAMGDALAPYLPDYLTGTMLQLLQAAVSLIVVSALFTAMFAIVPDVPIAWRDALIGGVVTGLLFVIGKTLIGIYLGRSAPGSAYGAAGALAAILVWIYYSAIILLLGAEFTQVWARRQGRAPLPVSTPSGPLASQSR